MEAADGRVECCWELILVISGDVGSAAASGRGQHIMLLSKNGNHEQTRPSAEVHVGQMFSQTEMDFFVLQEPDL